NWTLLGGELWLLEPRVVKLGDVRETPTSVADNSPTADITAELLDVGEGTEEGDYAGRDVSGKVVRASGPPNRVQRPAFSPAAASGTGRGLHSRLGHPRPGYRPHGAPAGGEDLRQRQPQRLREPARDRPRARSHDPRRAPSPPQA